MLISDHSSGALLSQYFVGEVHEQSVYTSLLLIQSFFAIAVQAAGVGSAALPFLTALPLFASLALNPAFASASSVATSRRISLWTYAIGQTLPLLTGTMLLIGVVEVFVPLVRRLLAIFRIAKLMLTVDRQNRCRCASREYHC